MKCEKNWKLLLKSTAGHLNYSYYEIICKHVQLSDTLLKTKI